MKFLTYLILPLLMFTSCRKVSSSATTPTPQPKETPPAAEAVQVAMKTTMGEITIELDPEKAPITVKNFLSYVEKKQYDNTVFHRVINDFMIQGGGFSNEGGTLREKATGDGIVNEGKNGLKNLRGTIAMARTGDPNSATAQFFINVVDNQGLDFPNPDGHGYAVFGKVVKGMEVVDQIKATAIATRNLASIHPHTKELITQPSTDVPAQDIIIESVRLVTP